VGQFEDGKTPDLPKAGEKAEGFLVDPEQAGFSLT